MRHQPHTAGISAADIERALDRLALEIKAFGPRGRALLPLYARLEDELELLRDAERMMQKVLARLQRL